MQDIILYPFSGTTREAVSLIQAINDAAPEPVWNILGFCDENLALEGITYRTYPILGDHRALKQYPDAKILVCPNQSNNCRTRHIEINKLGIPQTQFATLVHPSAQLGHESRIGFNTMVMGGVHLTNEVTVGHHSLILPNTVIGHEAHIGDYALVGANVSISGGVTIEENCYIGSGSQFLQGVTIRRGTIVGMGSVVLYSSEENSTLAGNPARALHQTSSSNV